MSKMATVSGMMLPSSKWTKLRTTKYSRTWAKPKYTLDRKTCVKITNWTPEKIQVHLVFTVKHDDRHKARLVVGVHLTPDPVESKYSGVVSIRSL